MSTVRKLAGLGLITIFLVCANSAAIAVEVIFAHDPSQSFYSVTGADNTFGVFAEQGPGSFASPISGNFLVDFDPFAPSSIQFILGHGVIDLDVTGDWLPGPDPGGNPASVFTPGPADVGGQTAGGDVKYALRDLKWDLQSVPIAINPGDNSFDANQIGYTVLDGSLDFVHPLTTPTAGTLPFAGDSGIAESAGLATLVESAPGSGSWTLTFSIQLTTQYAISTLGPDQGTLIYSSNVVTTAQFGSENVETITTAETMADVLGGAGVTGGVSVDLDSPPATQGTLSAQKIPFAGLSQDALAAAQANDAFGVSTADLMVDLQIWDVDFSGDLGGADVTLTFGYDEVPILAAGIDENDLGVWHFNSTLGDWEFGGAVDTLANTVAITVNSLSPFVMGAAIPEPATISLLALGALGPLGMGRRRRKRA